jgi:hypothetical protein
MAAVSDTRSVDIEDDIKRRRPLIHPLICICLILRRGGGSSCTRGGGAHSLVEPRDWWRIPIIGGAWTAGYKRAQMEVARNPSSQTGYI